MDKERQLSVGTLARKVLIPYWFEIVSGIFVSLSMVLIFARKVPLT